MGVIETILLDTNIVSFVLKSDTRAEQYQAHLQGRHLAISFMTVAELFQWAAVHNWGPQRISQLEEKLVINYRIMSFEFEICRLWGIIRAHRRAVGQPISPQDAWIAATALSHKLPLVTHNPVDFQNIKNLQIITAVR